MARRAKLLSSKKMLEQDRIVILYKNKKGIFRRVTLIEKQVFTKRKPPRTEFLYQFIGKSGFPSTRSKVCEFQIMGESIIDVTARDFFIYPKIHN